MAFLDFIKNRQAQPESAAQPSQQQKPETARQMYTQQAGQERAAQKSVQHIPEADKSEARDWGARLDKATQHIQHNGGAPAPAPADSTGSPEPMRQNMVAQNKSAPALSPTSAQLGQTANEKSAAQPSAENSKAPEKSAGQERQTMARRPPSWER
jgi:hypothetical protein